MEEVSLVFHPRFTGYAEQLAAAFREDGFGVFTGPSRLKDSEAYLRPQYHTKVTNFANVVLLSKELYRDHRHLVELFAAAVANDQLNVHIISMDDEWQFIPDQNLRQLAQVSYVRAFTRDRPDLTPSDIMRAIVSVASTASTSHLTTERFNDVLRESYDQIDLIVEEHDPKLRISFAAFDCIHRISSDCERFLVIYPSAVLESVKSFIETHHPALLSSSQSLFVVRSFPNREMSLRQREQTEELYGGRALRFETMVRDRRLRRSLAPTLTDPGEVAVSQRWTHSTPFGKSELTTEKVIELCSSSTEPYAQRRITIIHGAGGGGKTHFARFLNDKLTARNAEVFFLSAASIADFRQDLTVSSLYDIYRCCCLAEEEKIDIGKELFDLKFLVDEPVIIVDGLEEIISMLGERFSLKHFYADCIEKARGEANGRIIITTRDDVWPEAADPYVHSFELQLFDEAQAREFFTQAFREHRELLDVAMRIYRDLATERLPPLFCSLIALELKKTDSIQELRVRLNRGDFKSSSGLDEFLRATIARETKLGVDWPIDSTLAALGELARESVAGPIDFAKALDIFRGAFPDYVHVDLESTVKNFIFLEFYEPSQSLTFRYEFLKTVFLADYIVRCISDANAEILSTDVGLMVLQRHLVPGSAVLSKIIAADQARTADFLTVLDMMIQELNAGRVTIKNDLAARTVTSNLLFLRLSLDPQIRGIADSTRLIESLFGDETNPRIIDRLSIIRFDQDTRRSFRFNLAGKIVRGGHFASVPVDDCIEADETTVFTSCRFEQCLSDPPRKVATLWSARYDEDCSLDGEFRAALSDLKSNQEHNHDRKVAELKRFLRQFSHGHAFNGRRTRDALSGTLKGIVVDRMISVLKSHALLEDVPNEAPAKVRLTSSGSRSARLLVMDSAKSPEINAVLKEL